MPAWTKDKPKPPYAIELPPRYVDTPYDDLPTNIQQRLDVMRFDNDKPVPEPVPDVIHPVPDAPANAQSFSADVDEDEFDKEQADAVGLPARAAKAAEKADQKADKARDKSSDKKA